MKVKILFLFGLFFLLFNNVKAENKYKYEEIQGDSLKVRIYTLDNGLKVYLSVNKDAPRIQTYIAVKAGGKNDPKETTGLAHYFEHLMFKGTTHIGTTDYEAEKPYLDQIEELFEIYRNENDTIVRTQIYAQIDSLSQIASSFAIPNEYSKLMTDIGSLGTNAFTNYDITAYTENIPSNQVDNWLEIQLERFKNPVLRLFHTELETVYEEYNTSQSSDSRKKYAKLLELLFPNHPYGTQTVLGSPDNLKNPSIKNIKKFYDTYYVPNNMGVIMVGDFDFDTVIEEVDKTLGTLKPKDVPPFNFIPEKPIEKPIEAEVIGREAEDVTIGYRMPSPKKYKDLATLAIINYMLNNGKAGLIDLTLVKKQKLLSAGSGYSSFADYSIFTMTGRPKEGQSLEEVKGLLLEQIDMIKRGDYDDDLLQSVINNLRLSEYYKLLSIGSVSSNLFDAFVYDLPWSDIRNVLDYQATLTKDDITKFSNKYFGDNYVVVYKKQGNPDDPKIEKPNITPIKINRDVKSDYLIEIEEKTVPPIEPVFIDFEKEMSILNTNNGTEVLYKKNDIIPTFNLVYVFDIGSGNDKYLDLAGSYFNYLGTSKKSLEEINRELFKMACSFSIYSSFDKTYITISGLEENFGEAMSLLEEKLFEAINDTTVYENVVKDIMKSRTNAKLDKNAIFSNLGGYAQYGTERIKNMITSEELQNIDPKLLVDKMKDIVNYKSTILYYGPKSESDLLSVLNSSALSKDSLKPTPVLNDYNHLPVSKPIVYLIDYEANQISMGLYNRGDKYDESLTPVTSMYNSYFGGGMNSIVFQEMRESRALAYSAGVGYYSPNKPTKYFYLTGGINTQNDKMKDAIEAFDEILNNMPLSESSFERVKQQTLNAIRTFRIIRANVLNTFYSRREFGYKEDPNKQMFEALPKLKLDDIVDFQKTHIKDQPLVYYILGDLKSIDMEYLKTLGEVKIMTKEEIFGY